MTEAEHTYTLCKFVPGYAAGSEWEPDEWVPAMTEEERAVTIEALAYVLAVRGIRRMLHQPLKSVLAKLRGEDG